MSDVFKFIKNTNFQVEWDNVTFGFSKVSGLNFTREVIEYRFGNSKEESVFKILGSVKFGNIILKRGMTKGDNHFFNWWQEVSADDKFKKDVTISLLGEDHSPIVTWKARNAFPVKLECSDFDALGNEIVIETLEIAHEGLTIEFL